jgi:hypothetical protein
MINLGHWDIRVFQCFNNTIFTVNRMGGLEQFAGGLSAQHISSGVGINPESGIRLTTGKFSSLQWTFETRNGNFQILRQKRLIQPF